MFRITHTHSFNISIQALQLIYQVAIAIPIHGETARGFSSKVSDRYYRTLYESMLDSRLATTSKQAMYLNLVYKSIKSDDDLERVKAMIKRLCQILNMQEPPFIIGTLVLLGEVFKARPGLRSMITDPEEEGLEHFHDVVEDEAPGAGAGAGTGDESVTQATSYDGRKRDPRFAHAGDSALWDLLPLLQHFHPSVSLNARQLLEGVKITSTADLTLNTLMHFLDRFVFRNPKKHVSLKGTSIMQPALGGDLQDDVLVRRTDVPLDYVNQASFWSLRPEHVPADLRFFHQYFQSKLKRSQNEPEPVSKAKLADLEDAELGGELDELSTDDEEEKEIWQAMKASMPKHEDTEDLSDDDDTLAQLEADTELGIENEDEEDEDEDEDEDDASKGDESLLSNDQQAWYDEDSGEEDGAMFLEDEDDLVPFTNFDEESTPVAGRKRPADETDDAPASKNKGRTAQRQKRRALPEFASAEDYAHMLDSDDEGN